MNIKIDLKDKRLLYELNIDSRQSASQLAKKIGISKQGCTLKINNLIKKGVIKSFPTIIGMAPIGYLSFRMYFKLSDITPSQEEEFKTYLINHHAIPWVVGCEGTWDYIIVIFPKDFTDFENINSEINNVYGQYIEKKDIALVTIAHNFRPGYILGKKHDIPPISYAGQPKEIIQLDETDKNILVELAKNSRTPIIEIAKKIRTPAKTVAYRIEKLERLKIIEGYIVTIDLEKIGFERYKVFIRTKNMSQQKEKHFIEWSRMHPYALYYSRSIGENDVELEFIVHDNTHLREIIADIRNVFGEIIKSYEILKIYKEFKLNYYPHGKSN